VKVKDIFTHIEEILGCIFLAIFVGLTILNVFLRYGFNFILTWAEEGILVAFTWCVFLGVITAFRADRHVAIDVVVKLFPPAVQKGLSLGVDILVLLLNGYITYLGIVLCANVGVKTTLVMHLSYVWLDITIVLGFGLMTIFGVVKLFLRLTGRYEETDAITRTINEVNEAVEAAKE
jgi:TRAP-type C4-dicarboxylate transport system permease small subunit